MTPAIDLITVPQETTIVNTVPDKFLPSPRRGWLPRIRRSLGAVVAAVLLALVIAPSALAAPSGHPFEIERGSFHIHLTTERAITNPNNPKAPPLGWETLPLDQAGAHENLTTEFNFEHSKGEKVYNEVKDTFVDLPPGFIGSNTAIPTCLDTQLAAEYLLPEEGEPCPPDTQVGTISLTLNLFGGNARVLAPVFNMEENTGVTSTLGFNVLGQIVQVLPISLRPSDHGLTRRKPLDRGFRRTQPHQAHRLGPPGGAEPHCPTRGIHPHAYH